MSDFPTAATVEAAIRAHLIAGSHRDAFVDVYLVPGKEESIYAFLGSEKWPKYSVCCMTIR